MSEQLTEIRRYVSYPGKRAELADYLDRVVIPFVRARGVEVNASLLDQNDENVYIWVRTFQNEADRAEKYRLIYQDAAWAGDIEPIVRKLMDFEQAVITTARPTAPLPWNDGGRLDRTPPLA